MLLIVLMDTSTNTTANIIAAGGAVAGVLTSLALLIPTLRQVRETKTEVKATKADVADVHTIVNQQRTDAQRYQVALVELLKFHGIEVPIDQSLPVADPQVRQPPAPGTAPPVEQAPPLVMKEVREGDEPT